MLRVRLRLRFLGRGRGGGRAGSGRPKKSGPRAAAGAEGRFSRGKQRLYEENANEKERRKSLLLAVGELYLETAAGELENVLFVFFVVVIGGREKKEL